MERGIGEREGRDWKAGGEMERDWSEGEGNESFWSLTLVKKP